MEIDKKVLISSLLEVGSSLLFATGVGMIVHAKLNSRINWADYDIEMLKQRVDSLEKSNKK